VHAVREVLRRHGIPDRAVQRSRLGLKSLWSFGADRKFLGHECQASFAVECTDLDDVQQLLIDVVAAGPNEIEGSISMSPASRTCGLRRVVRQLLQHGARRDSTPRRRVCGWAPGAAHRPVGPENLGPERLRGHFAGAQASAEDFAPGHVVVSAAVVLGFAIIHD
jgi:uncharacterized protein